MIPLTNQRTWVSGLLVALMVSGALWGHQQLDLWYQGGWQPPPPVDDGNDGVPSPPDSASPDEVPDEGETGEPEYPPLPSGPKLAIIIDDLGYDADGTDAILALPYPLTMAVLPDGPTTENDIEAALAHGHQVFLHLPMEPLGGYPGLPQVIATDMDDEEIDQLVTRYLDQMPQAVGVNNHMGSKATSDRRIAQRVLALVAEAKLVFVDSRTWRGSVMCEVAAEMDVPCAFNQLFLDNDKRLAAITGRLQEAARLAQEEGAAVVIGHVHPMTALALEQTLPQLVEEGIHLVFASRLARAGPGERRVQ